MPFDWKTPYGYCIAFLIQCVDVYALLLNSFPSLVMLIGSCWLLNGMCDDIKSDISILNTNKIILNGNLGNAVRHLRNVIREFLTVKQLSVQFLFEMRKIKIILSATICIEIFMLFQSFFCFFLFRFVKEFNENHQIIVTTTYWWARFTIWSVIAILIIQLVEYKI